MPPQFKRPTAYDPTQASRTLEQSHAAERQKRAMLAELGLADEDGEDLDGEDLDGDDMDGDREDVDESETPIFSSHGQPSGGGAHMGGGSQGGSSHGGGANSTHGYQDVFGKQHTKRRQQQIDLKGYERYVQDLMERSTENLQLLRSDTTCQFPGRVEVIGELQHELQELTAANRSLQDAGTKGVPSAGGSAGDDDAAALRRQLAQLQAAHAQLQASNARVQDRVKAAEAEAQRVGAQLAQAQAALSEARSAAAASTSAATAAAAATSGVQADVAKLQADLAAKDAQLAAQGSQMATQGARVASAAATISLPDTSGAHADVAKLQAELADRDARLAAQASTVVEQAAAVAAQRARIASLEAELLERQSDAAAANGDADAAARCAAEGTEAAGKRAAADAAALSEAGARAAAETARAVSAAAAASVAASALAGVELELAESKAAHAESQASLVAARAQLAAGVRGAGAAVRAKLKHLYGQIDAMHALREGLLKELVSMQTDLLNDKTMAQMARIVRDREISGLKKAEAGVRKQADDATARAAELEGALLAEKEAKAQALRIVELEANARVKHFSDKWRAEFDKRRKLHNAVLDMKGSIRVLCRVRPMIGRELEGVGAMHETCVRPMHEEGLRLSLGEGKGEKDFEFDHVFGQSDGQGAVYEEVAALITSVLDGYNVSMMAYGQTGSGKTFTMEGPDDNPGVNTRALEDVFRLAAERTEDWEFGFKASVLEIYNENLYDLLVAGKEQDDKLDVKQGADGAMYVPGLIVEDVSCIADVLDLIARGKRNRSTFSTNMNEHSSRSHLVLSLQVVASSKASATSRASVPGGAPTTLRGKLNLIDLAGSERISKSGAQGERLKEAQNINKSLSALGDVIQALQQREKHIPYRNSKLTRLLEDSLGASASKCVMMCNVSPSADNAGETKCSLEFASRARKVELGAARRNIDSPSPLGPASATASPRFGGSLGGAGTRPSSGASTPGSMSRVASNGMLSSGSRPPPAPR